MDTPSYGSRIKYNVQGKLLVSNKVFLNGDRSCRVILDTEQHNYKFVDPVTGHVLVIGDAGWTSMEVVQRNAKKALEKYLKIKFEKEIKAKPTPNV